METESVHYSSTVELAKALAGRELTSRDLLEVLLERIARVNGTLNAVVALEADRARERAAAADAARERGDTWGPLHGIPMTVKDSLDTIGIVSTGGTTGRRHFVPSADATVVSRLKKAGAIVFGKTNTPELTLSFETDNDVYGLTKNPYDTSRSPGGSSGGAAAILAAGGTPLEVGSDYGGSIRVPSAFCGTAGIKPTMGRVPRCPYSEHRGHEVYSEHRGH
jgi:amidase